MKNYKQELLDHFAMSAMNSLIMKMPFYDSKAEHGEPIDETKLQEIKKLLTASAYEYAGWMMIAREDSKKWLEKNIENNSDFGS